MQDTPRWLQTSPLDGGPVIRDGDRTIVFEPVSPDWNPKKPWWRKVLHRNADLLPEEGGVPELAEDVPVSEYKLLGTSELQNRKTGRIYGITPDGRPYIRERKGKKVLLPYSPDESLKYRMSDGTILDAGMSESSLNVHAPDGCLFEYAAVPWAHPRRQYIRDGEVYEDRMGTDRWDHALKLKDPALVKDPPDFEGIRTLKGPALRDRRTGKAYGVRDRKLVEIPRAELEEVEELRAKAEDPDQFLWRYGKPYRPKRSLLKRISDYITGNTNK